MPLQLTPRLCPKVHSKLTLDGAASDGVGILQRLQDEISDRAHKIWLQTGNPDAVANWKAAEKDVLILVHGVEEKLVRDLESNAATQDSNLEKKDVDESRSVQDELLKIREDEVQKLKEDIATQKRLKEEEIAKRQEEGARIKELESALESRSARMAQMMEDHKVELNKRNEKEEDLDKKVKLLTAELEGNNQKMKDLEKEVKLRTAELEGKNQEMKDLTGENTAQAKEIEDLKQQLKELEETQRKREKDRH